MDRSGIPRPLGREKSLAERVEALEILLEQATSRRVKVPLSSIVQGGSVSDEVGTQLTETVQEKIIVGRDNVADEALDQRTYTGSVFRTGVSGPRVQMDDGGVTAHGRADETVGNGGKIAHLVRAALANRRSQWGVSSTDLWPGVWFESDPVVPDSGLRPKWPAHVTVDAATAFGLVTRSAQQTDTSGRSESGVLPGRAYLSSEGEVAASGSRPASYLGLSPWEVKLTVTDAAGKKRIGLESDSSTDALKLTAAGGASLNGRPVLPITVAGAAAGTQARGIVGTGSALTDVYGVFTITYADGGFSSGASLILVTPTSGTAGFPVVNAGRLFKSQAEMVIPSAPNTSITYSYLVIGY